MTYSFGGGIIIASKCMFIIFVPTGPSSTSQMCSPLKKTNIMNKEKASRKCKPDMKVLIRKKQNHVVE